MSLLLQRLPPELLSYFIRTVDNKRDLKSLRLTCRLLRDFCTPQLYSDVYVTTGGVYAYHPDSDDSDSEPDYSDFEFRLFNHGQKRFQKFATTYGHLMRSLEVNFTPEDPESGAERSPFEIAGFLDYMPNLRAFTMRGALEYTYINSEEESDEEVNYYPRLRMSRLLARATLQTPPQDRPLQQLHYLDLNIYNLRSDTVSPWCLEGFGAVFIIPTLQKLALSHVIVGDNDLRFFPKFQRETDLTALCFNSAVMSVQSLSKILSFPRALRSLQLYGVKPHEDEWLEGAGTPEDLYRAILQHRASLEVLSVLRLAHRLHIDKAEFPKLRTTHGCRERSSGAP